MRIKAVLVTIIIGCISFVLFGCSVSNGSQPGTTQSRATAGVTATGATAQPDNTDMSVSTAEATFVIPEKMGRIINKKRYKRVKEIKAVKRRRLKSAFSEGEKYEIKYLTNIKAPYLYVNWDLNGIDNNWNIYNGAAGFGFMNNGTGWFETNLTVKKQNTEDSSCGSGFSVGNKVDPKDFRINVKSWYDKNDPERFLEILNIKTEIESRKYKNGLLFYKMDINGEKNDSSRTTVMIDGKATYLHNYDFDLGKKKRVKSVEVTPLYFVPAHKLNKREYSCLKNNFDKPDPDIVLYGEGVIELNSKKNGVLLTKCFALNKQTKEKDVSNQADIFFQNKCLVYYNVFDLKNIGSESRYTRNEVKNLKLGIESVYYIPVFDYAK